MMPRYPNPFCKPMIPFPGGGGDSRTVPVLQGIPVPPDPCAKPFDYSLRDRLTNWVAGKRAVDRRDLSAGEMLEEIGRLLGEG